MPSRSLSYFIHLFGILPRFRGGLVDRAWRIYAIRDRARRRKEAESFVRHHHTMWTKVHFLGCFDTVAALGSPYQWASRLLDRLPGIYPRHTVRIDEDPEGHMHDSRSGIFRIYRREPRSWDNRRADRPVLHESVLRRRRNRANGDSPPYDAWLSAHEPEVEPWVPYAEQRWTEEAAARVPSPRPPRPLRRPRRSCPSCRSHPQPLPDARRSRRPARDPPLVARRGRDRTARPCGPHFAS